MELVRVEAFDHVHDKIDCDPGIAEELKEHFTFTVPGAQFSPAVQNKWWDGRARLFSPFTGLLYCGLRGELEKFCKDRDYTLEYSFKDAKTSFSIQEAHEFCISVKNNPEMEDRPYQVIAFAKMVREGRGLILSPTSSGKSFLMYLLMKWYKTKTLVIVPETSLIHQMAREYEEYAGHELDVHKIYAGQEKETRSPITITTWQSVVKQPESWFSQFGLILGDEAHLWKAKSLVTIMTKTRSVAHKFGFTGTLDDSVSNKLTITGLFGKIIRTISTREMIDAGYAADMTIKCLILSYPDEVRKVISGKKYQDELDWIVRCEARNQFVKNLALSLQGNTIILFQFTDKHGIILHKLIEDAVAPGRKVFYVAGQTDSEVRDDIKGIVEKEKDAIIVASSVFTTGVSIKNLHNIIFTSPSKARVRVLQSIGRGLRISKTKTSVTLFDIADDLKWKSNKNYTLDHFFERVKMYASEKHQYKMYKIDLTQAVV